MALLRLVAGMLTLGMMDDDEMPLDVVLKQDMPIDGTALWFGITDDSGFTFTEFKPHGKVFAPNGLGTFVAQLL